MLRRLISLILLIIIGYLVYKAFYGTTEEKEQVSVIKDKSLDLGKDIFLVGSELGRDLLDYIRNKRQEENVEELGTSLDSFNRFLEDWSEDLPAEKRNELQNAIQNLRSESSRLREELKDKEEVSQDSIKSWRNDIAVLLEKLNALVSQ